MAAFSLVPDLDSPGAPSRHPLHFRPAARTDSRAIAELFRISSNGLADYVWSQLENEHPGLTLTQIGERRYLREAAAFSFQNCTVASHVGQIRGMVHAYPLGPDEPAPDLAAIDPVLRPYAELEVPGSLFISGLAVRRQHRDRGLGTMLLVNARRRAKNLGLRRLSLICFEANTGAQRLYARHGFTVVDSRKVVPHPLIHVRGDALLMVAGV